MQSRTLLLAGLIASGLIGLGLRNVGADNHLTSPPGARATSRGSECSGIPVPIRIRLEPQKGFIQSGKGGLNYRARLAHNFGGRASMSYRFELLTVNHRPVPGFEKVEGAAATLDVGTERTVDLSTKGLNSGYYIAHLTAAASDGQKAELDGVYQYMRVDGTSVVPLAADEFWHQVGPIEVD